MSSKTFVIGQDKNYEGKLSKQVVDGVITKFQNSTKNILLKRKL